MTPGSGFGPGLQDLQKIYFSLIETGEGRAIILTEIPIQSVFIKQMARVPKENIRERILEAAEKRLWHFGLKKTTIDEIASDAEVGKGTVYLYFDSKEEIAIAIMGKYKAETVEQQAAIARDESLNPLEKLHRMVKLPVMAASATCSQYPQALEVVVAVKPHFALRLQPHIKREIELIADVLEEGNRQGLFDIENAVKCATTLKQMTLGFMPPYPCFTELQQIEAALDNMVDLAFCGLKTRTYTPDSETHRLRTAIR